MFQFLLGLTVGWAFWGVCERYARRGLLLHVNPITFILMVIWGSSGFFLLRIFPQNEFSSLLQFLYLPVPDWDIPLSVWTGWDFLIHRSLLFSSNILPIACIGLSWLLLNFSRQRSSSTGLRVKSLLLNMAIGLSVGVSAHLLGDVLLNLILNGKDLILFRLNSIFSGNYSYRSFNFEIGNRGVIFSLVWVGLNSFIGIMAPFAIILLASAHKQVKP